MDVHFSLNLLIGRLQNLRMFKMMLRDNIFDENKLFYRILT